MKYSRCLIVVKEFPLKIFLFFNVEKEVRPKKKLKAF